ncbi:MAG: hypothetical protein WBE79_08765 [Candidatus Cybelea sp.]|jgi:hypothetical protein
MTLHRIYIPLILLSSSVLFVGCSGTSQAPLMGGLPSGSRSIQIPADNGRNRQECQNDGGINLRPCQITFDAQNPGPTDVRVTHDGDGGRHDRDGGRHNRISERDNCAARGVAMVVRDSNSRYTAMAGMMAGTCSATFNDNGNRNDDGGGGRNGGTQLRIVNKL